MTSTKCVELYPTIIAIFSNVIRNPEETKKRIQPVSINHCAQDFVVESRQFPKICCSYINILKMMFHEKFSINSLTSFIIQSKSCATCSNNLNKETSHPILFTSIFVALIQNKILPLVPLC